MGVRYAHTDVTVPDFNDYRVGNLSPQSLTNFREREDQRRTDNKSFNYAVTGMPLSLKASTLTEVGSWSQYLSKNVPTVFGIIS